MAHENASYISLRVPQRGPFTFVKNPHITLGYFKDTAPEEIADALPETLGRGAHTLEVRGAGVWRGQMTDRPPYWVVYASVDLAWPGIYLRDLRDLILVHTQAVGLHVDRAYDFTPHITVDVVESTEAARERLPLIPGGWRFTADTLYISRPGMADRALTVDL